MKKVAFVIALCMVCLMVFVACGGDNNGTPANTNTNEAGNEAENETGNEAENETGNEAGNETGNEAGNDEDDDEEYLYFYNPKLVNAYRKNDTKILFQTDIAVIDPDGNLYTHIYFASAENGDPLMRAVSAAPYDGDSSKIWEAVFEGPLPETGYICFEDSDGNGDADFETVLADNVGFGIYAAVKMADGSRVAATPLTDTVIDAHMSVVIPDNEIDLYSSFAEYTELGDAAAKHVHDGEVHAEYNNGWQYYAEVGPLYHDAIAHYNHIGNGCAVITFTGVGFEVWGPERCLPYKHGFSDDVCIYVDGVLVTEPNQLSHAHADHDSEDYLWSDWDNTKPLYTQSGLEYGEHTVVITNGDEGKGVYLEQFDYFVD